MASPTKPLFFFLGSLLVLCSTQDTGSSGQGSGNVISQTNYRSSGSKKSPFSDPGVIIGIIVGVVGILVVAGVTILLCKLFCCKQSSCCSCCRRGETYHEASSLPYKAPADELSSDHKPLSIISQDREPESHKNPRPHSRRRDNDRAKDPPKYDDVQQFNRTIKEFTKSEPDWNGEPETRSTEGFAVPSDEEAAENVNATSKVLKNKKKKKQKSASASRSSNNACDTRQGNRDGAHLAHGGEEEEFSPVMFELNNYNGEPTVQDGKIRMRHGNVEKTLCEDFYTSELGNENYGFEPSFAKRRLANTEEDCTVGPFARETEHKPPVQTYEKDVQRTRKEYQAGESAADSDIFTLSDHRYGRHAADLPLAQERVIPKNKETRREYEGRAPRQREHRLRGHGLEDRTRTWIHNTPHPTMDEKDSSHRAYDLDSSCPNESTRNWHADRMARGQRPVPQRPTRLTDPADLTHGNISPESDHFSSGKVNQGLNDGSTETEV